MQIVCTSDLHGFLPKIPECDLLLIAGDLGPANALYHQDFGFAKRWLRETFEPWLKNCPAENTVGICGNHDFLGEKSPDPFRNLSWNYLCGETITIDELRIFGDPHTPFFFDWAFNFPREDSLAGSPYAYSYWKEYIPDDADIVVSHGPPYGILDQNPRGQHCGDPALNKRITEVKPKLHVFGHIHHGHGLFKHDGTTFVNASYANEEYKPEYEPIIVEI